MITTVRLSLRSQTRRFSTVIEVTGANFKEKVMDSKVPVILDCHAEWCAPCRDLGPRLEKAVQSHGGKVVMAKLDVDEHPELAAKLKVEMLPGVMTFFEGKSRDSFYGAIPQPKVEDYVSKAAALTKL